MMDYKIPKEEIEQLQRDLYSYPIKMKDLRRKYILPLYNINDDLSGLARKEKRGKLENSEYKEKKNILINRRNEIEKKLQESEEYLFTNRINDLIKTLPECDQDLIYDKFFSRMSFAELAEIHYRDKSTISSDVKRALRKMIRSNK